MFKKKKPATTSPDFCYGPRTYPSPPQATEQEKADAADQFTDLVDQSLVLLEKAKKLVWDQEVEAYKELGVKHYSWSGHYPRFPLCGSSLVDDIITAQASLIEAGRTVAVQGYSAKRNLEKETQ